MKKIIIKITSALTVITAITSVAVFTTASVSSLPPVRIFDAAAWEANKIGSNRNSLSYAQMSTTDVSIKDLLMGSKSFNNGNYVLFIGSESEQATLDDLYDSPGTPGNLANNVQPNFGFNASGSADSYSETIDNFYTSPAFKEDNNSEKPQFLMYLDKLNGVVSKEQKDYTATEEKYKQDHRDGDAKTIPVWDDSSYLPGATYTKDDKTYKFRNDQAAQDYLDIKAFIQTAYGSLGTLSYPFIISFTTDSVDSGGSVWSNSIAHDDTSNDDATTPTSSSTNNALQSAQVTGDTNMSEWIQGLYGYGKF